MGDGRELLAGQPGETCGEGVLSTDSLKLCMWYPEGQPAEKQQRGQEAESKNMGN